MYAAGTNHDPEWFGELGEACTLSLREHRPVQIEEVRIP